MGTNLDTESLPLVFVRPVGFSAADSLRLMTAAQRQNEQVRWRLAPIGVQADVYLAHRDRITAKPPTRRHSDFAALASVPNGANGSNGSFNTYSGRHEHSRLWVDENGQHKNTPVCLLGRANTDASPDSYLDQAPSLEFPQALEELRNGLYKAAQGLIGLRTLYALGMGAWEERTRWKSHRLHLTHNARLLAVIEPEHWRVHLLSGCNIEQVLDGSFSAAPQTTAFGAEGFDTLLLETALWEFAKRCPEPMLASMLPSAYLHAPLTHRRPSELTEAALGDHCVAVLLALDTRSRSADELQASLRLSRPALLRALACLALSRCIRPERERRSLAWTITGWLPKSLRTKLFGPSVLF